MTEDNYELLHLKIKPDYEDTENNYIHPLFESGHFELSPNETGMIDGASVPHSPLTSVSLNAEEVTIVVFVLMLWMGAIALFYHQWGKINGLEPYQPDFVHANLTLYNNGPQAGSVENNLLNPTTNSLGLSMHDLSGNHGIHFRSESTVELLHKNVHQCQGKPKNSQSLEEPMTPSVVISFEAETCRRASHCDGEKSRPRSLVSLADIPSHLTTHGLVAQKHLNLYGKMNWSLNCSTTSLQKSVDTAMIHKGNSSTSAGLSLPVSRTPHGRSMIALNRLGPSHLNSAASSVTSSRGFGLQRTYLAPHHRHLAESTLKLWQQKPQTLVFAGGSKGRRKSLSVSSLRMESNNFV